MKRMTINKLIFFIILFLVITFNFSLASSGKLRDNSITKGQDGNMYGAHGKDNHWHRAVKRDKGWYPDGEKIYTTEQVKGSSNKVVESKPTASSTKVSKPSETTVKKNNNIPKAAAIAASVKKEEEKLPEVKKSSDTSIKEFLIEDEVKTFENDVLNYETNKLELSFKVVLNDEKSNFTLIDHSSNSTFENYMNINKQNENSKFILKVTAENGDIKEYTINVKNLQKIEEDNKQKEENKNEINTEIKETNTSNSSALGGLIVGGSILGGAGYAAKKSKFDFKKILDNIR